jgi:hypothetical protein
MDGMGMLPACAAPAPPRRVFQGAGAGLGAGQGVPQVEPASYGRPKPSCHMATPCTASLPVALVLSVVGQLVHRRAQADRLHVVEPGAGGGVRGGGGSSGGVGVGRRQRRHGGVGPAQKCNYSRAAPTAKGRGPGPPSCGGKASRPCRQRRIQCRERAPAKPRLGVMMFKA